MKKIFTLLLLCYVGIFGKASAADGDTFTNGQFKFKILSEEEKTVRLNGYIEEDETVVEVPSTTTYNGVEYTVTTFFQGFYKTKKVEKIIIPNSVTSLQLNAISYNEALKEIVFPENSIKYLGQSCMSNNTVLETIILPNSIDSIAKSALANNAALKTLKLPESLRVLGYRCFSSLKLLSEITIPESVKIMEDEVFMNCFKLASLHIPAGVTTIGDGLGINCDKLKTITVDPKNEYFITENNVLYNKDKTRLITFPAGNSALTEYVVPSTITDLSEYIFARNTYIKSITIPEEVRTIGLGAFLYCKGMKEIKLPSKVKDLGDYFFYGCTALEKVWMGNLRKISGNSFYDTNVLKEVYFNCQQPVETASKIFTAYTLENGTLYVPAEQVENAQITPPWKNFPNIVAYDFNSGVGNVNVDDPDAPIEVFNFNGIKVGDSTKNLPTGLYIVRQNGKTSKISVTSNY